MKALGRPLVGLVCVLVVALAAGAAGAAPATKAASQPAAEPVLKVVPAGTLGYVVLHNLRTASDDVDKFLKAIGASELLKSEIPEGALKALLKALPLEEGFNPNGGIAIAMLDPAAFGIDMAQLLKSAVAGGAPAAAPGSAPATAPQWPFVLFLPGSGVKEVLGKLNPQVAAPYMKLNLDGMEVFAAPLGSYVLLSPNPKALEAVARADKKADDELQGRHAQVVRGSAAAVRLNAKAAYPLLQKALKALDLLMSAQEEGLIDSGSARSWAGIYKELKPGMGAYLYQLSQMEELTFGLRIAETGVVMDAAVSYQPDTPYAKALGAFQAPSTPMMDLLPSESYFMALSMAALQRPAAREIADKSVEAILDNPALAKVPRAQREKIAQLAGKFLEECTGVGLVMSGSPAEAKGMLSIALVLKGKDSRKIQALLAESAALVEETVKAAAPDNEDLKDLKVVYQKGVEKVGDAAVDSISVTGPGMEGGVLSMVFGEMFGESGLSALVAAADKDTVVVSFGGGKEALERALKAAAGKEERKILAQKETAEALKYMPKDPGALFFFSVGNYFDAMVTGLKKSGEGAAPPIPFAFTCKTPIAIGAGVEGTTQVFSAYVPTEVVKEVVGFVTALRGMFGGGVPGPGPGPVPGGEEF